MSLREIWDRINMRPWRLVLLLLSFAIVLVALVFARLVLPTCDAQEKAALAEFPQHGGRVAGKDLDIHGDEPNWPPLQEPPPGCALEFATPQASPEQVFMDGRSSGSPSTRKESSSTRTLRAPATVSVTWSTPSSFPALG
jgi:hypothetical protein